MRRPWLLPSILLSIACSNPPASAQGETPTVVLRCQEGRVSAYMVVTSTPQIIADDLPDDAVEIHLDSAPACSESAP